MAAIVGPSLYARIRPREARSPEDLNTSGRSSTSGLGLRGLGFRALVVWGLGFRGLGFRVYGV